MAGAALVSLATGMSLLELGQPTQYAYFLEHGLISFLPPLPATRPGHLNVIGREGMVGLAAFLSPRATLNRSVVQIPVEAWQVPHERLQETIGLEEVNRLLKRYTAARLIEMYCNLA